MLTFLARRSGFFVLTLFLASVLVFGATSLLPGDVARVILGREAEQSAIDNLRQELGLNEPFFVQYGRWLVNFVQGDWGRSYALKQEIQPLVLRALNNSIRLALVAILISIPPAIFLGLLAGLNENKPFDHAFTIGSLILTGLPEFVMGILLINVVALQWRLLPSSSAVDPDATFVEALPRLILPSLTVATVLLAYVGRLTRIGVINEMRRTYVRTALLKGMPYWQVIFKHVLRNALLPTITVIAISLGWLISGLAVIENVFSYPGLGKLLVAAINNRDLPLIQAGVMISVAAFASANLLADILYAYLNPRIRLQ